MYTDDVPMNPDWNPDFTIRTFKGCAMIAFFMTALFMSLVVLTFAMLFLATIYFLFFFVIVMIFISYMDEKIGV